MTPEKAAAADGPLIGHDIDERYRLEGVIGVGGLGSVYRATHTKLQRSVAVKLLHETFGDSQVQLGRFAREAKALAALQHPNIVAVLDYGVSGARPYLVMELLEGETLSQRLHRGPLSVESALSIVQQLLEALSFMHRAQLVHRDIKPSNVFLQRTRDGHDRVKVLDLGLAKFTTPPLVASGDPTLTREGAVVGTPAYMSPEQATGEAVDARSDVYAVGVILFRMLSGRLPFEGDAIEQVRSHLIAPVPALARAEPDAEVDSALEALIQRAMAKRREDRFSDAGEMLRALADAFPNHVRATLPEHEAVPDPFAVDATRVEWLVSQSDDPSDVSTMPRVPVPGPSLRTRVKRVGRAVRVLIVTSVRLFAGVSVLLVVGTGAILVLLLRDEADRAELSALQRRVSDRLIERSLGAAESAPSGSASHAPPQIAPTDGERAESPALTAAAPGADRPPRLEAVAGAPEPTAASGDQPASENAQPSLNAASDPGGGSSVAAAAASGDQPASENAEPSPNAASDPGGGSNVAAAATVTSKERTGESEPAAPGEVNGIEARSDVAGAAASSSKDSKLQRDLAAAASPTGEHDDPAAPSGASGRQPAALLPGAPAAATRAPASAALSPALRAPLAVAPWSVASAKQLDTAFPKPGPELEPPPRGLEAAVGAGGQVSGPEVAEPPSVPSDLAAPAPAPAPAVASAAPLAAAGGDEDVDAQVPARDPWSEPVPGRLRWARRIAQRGGRGNDAMLDAVRDYNKATRGDARGHLILAQLYLNRFWRADALSQFSIAMRVDPSARGAPEVLDGLLSLVAHGEHAAAAERIVVQHFGREAGPAIERRLATLRAPRATARLRRLQSKL